MRSLNLLFGKTSKASTFQIIWEIWFTLSTFVFIAVVLTATVNSEYIHEGVLILSGFIFFTSVLVGLITTEQLTDVVEPTDNDIIDGQSYNDYINQPDID